MLFLTKPDDARIREVIAAGRRAKLTYDAVGATSGQPPAGYVVDHNRVRLGPGKESFERAAAAIRTWEPFRLGWTRLCFPDQPIAVGTIVGVLARHFGFWSLQPSRIVEVIDEPRRFGFAYGTLPGHAESGEERFLVEHTVSDDSVWYDLLSFSRPNATLARLGYPVSRMLQHRFAADSKQAMMRATRVRFG